jgi:hypothetical protein
VVALAWVVAHGGISGAIAEGTIALAVVALFVAVWLRERAGGEEQDGVSRRERRNRRKRGED